MQEDHFKAIATICAEREEEGQFHLEAVNGMEDHVHILIQIHPNQPVAKVIGWIKGATSHAFGENFEWQSGYLIQTVSPEQAVEYRGYVELQQEVHSSGEVRPAWELPE